MELTKYDQPDIYKQDEKLQLLEEFLGKHDDFYLNSTSRENRLNFRATEKLDAVDLALYHVTSITHRDKAPSKEALENVLNAIKIPGVNFVYLLLGYKNGVRFYYGIAKDNSKENDAVRPKLSIQELGENILLPSIKGNFRGSDIKKVGRNEKEKILEMLQNFAHCDILEGVPGIIENKEMTNSEKTFQGMDRLVDVMLSVDSEQDDSKSATNLNEVHPFGFMVIASPLRKDELYRLESNIFDVCDVITPYANKGTEVRSESGVQRSESESENDETSVGYSKSNEKSNMTNESWSNSNTTSTSKSESTQTTNGGSYSSTSTSKSNSGTESETRDERTDKQNSTRESEQDSVNVRNSESKGKQTGLSHNFIITNTIALENKSLQSWLKYIDEVILPRLDYGFGRGAFAGSVVLFSSDKASLRKLENTAISLFGGQSGNKVPLKSFELENDSLQLQAIKNLQLPRFYFQNRIDSKHHSILSQCVGHRDGVSSGVLGNWLTAQELSLLVGLPTKEVMGVELKEEVEFGLNCPTSNDSIMLGHLMQNGQKTIKKVGIAKENLDKHIFISGVTGSGKTTTSQRILIQSNLPFMVIEPAKTEYRIMKNKPGFEDLLIFTLGKDTLAPFRLNPFEFFEHESITSRVDMIKASIEAAFDMEAAIPQIIESALYECYEDYGWNIATNENLRYKDAFADGVYAFPTLSDLMAKIESVVEKQGFDKRLKDDYIGSIRARLKGLTLGAKGFMLDTERSINFMDLLDRKVVFELEEIRNGSEKSLVMGFILGNMLEAIKHRFKERPTKEPRHILLVEEAHRLLSKYEAGDSQNKKQGVEVFADMLAEIRKYGECLIIADQIPNKLTPEVLKNTNTKIVHRIFAGDDKEAIANTIALEDEQVEFLSKLPTGVAVVFSGGFNKAVSVKIEQDTDTTSKELLDEQKIQDEVYKYYANTSKRGVIVGSQLYKNATPENIHELLAVRRESPVREIMEHFKSTRAVDSRLREKLEACLGKFSMEFLLDIYFLSGSKKHTDDKRLIAEFLEKYSKNNFGQDDIQTYFDLVYQS